SSANTTPGRLRKGKRMPGHMGQDRITSVNIKVAYVDVERNLLGVAGSVPGGAGTVVVIKPSVKAKGAK
ncbi:MAG TPA: 50S ribosomal protein L3, partial [Anaerolineales bacterium]|nr:50S ribosomal protein L3 [Anaerolineales bacterium]